MIDQFDLRLVLSFDCIGIFIWRSNIENVRLHRIEQLIYAMRAFNIWSIIIMRWLLAAKYLHTKSGKNVQHVRELASFAHCLLFLWFYSLFRSFPFSLCFFLLFNAYSPSSKVCKNLNCWAVVWEWSYLYIFILVRVRVCVNVYIHTCSTYIYI